VFRGVGQFVREHGGVTLRIAEGLEGRHLHIVRAFGVIGAGAAVANFNAGRGLSVALKIAALRNRKMARETARILSIVQNKPIQMNDKEYPMDPMDPMG
jgi:hypothetical protein